LALGSHPGQPMPVGQAMIAQAVIFDLDGLLVDTESLAMRALESAAPEFGIIAPQWFRHSLIGISADQCLLMVLDRFGETFPAEDYLARASREMEALVSRGELKCKPGAIELLQRIDEVGLPKAVATSSSRAKAMLHLRHVELLERFDAIVTRDDVAKGKPAPDLFLEAARRVGVPPVRCVVLEDSHNGVRAASAAGACVIMVPDLLAATDEMRKLCHAIVPDLAAAGRLFLSPRATTGPDDT
jgi:HAD superfamily hydrolase (TIGR01509 family)